MLDLESVMWLYYGEKGTNWEYAKTGDQGINGEQAIFKTIEWPPPTGQAWTQAAVTFSRPTSAAARPSTRTRRPSKPTCTPPVRRTKPSRSRKTCSCRRVIIEVADAAAVADAEVSINQHITTSISEFSLGKKDPTNDRDWNEYVDTFESMNLDGYLEIYQRAYDSRPN